MIKEDVDKQLRGKFQVCIGASFGYDIQFATQGMLLAYYRSLAVLIYTSR